MIHQNIKLRYVVVEHHKMTLTPRARFAEEDEAKWYAMNVWKASKASGYFAYFRVLDVQDKVELSVYGTFTPLYDNEINVACVMYGNR